MKRTALALLAPLLAACAGVSARTTAPAPPPVPAIAEPGVTYDTTWYVTNRLRRDAELIREESDSLEFGLIVTRYREVEGNRLLEPVSSEFVDSARFPRGEFLARLAARDSAPGSDGTIVYVHGYAVSFGRSIRQGGDIAHRGSHRGPMVVFSWPAHGSVVTWPTPSALVSRAYRDDSLAATRSQAAFRDVVADLRGTVRPAGLTLVGHSLGARIVAEALAAPGPLRDSLQASPLGALVFFAADVDLDRFRDTLAPALASIASRRVIYASDDDRMMGLSRLLNGSPRAGMATPARALAPRGLEVVDVTDGRRADGFIRKLFEPEHAMRYASAALYDFFGVVRGVPATCRESGGVARRVEAGVWQLVDAPVPDASFRGC